MIKVLQWELLFCLEFIKYAMAYKISTRKKVRVNKYIILSAMIISFCSVLFMADRLYVDDAYMILLLLALLYVFMGMHDKYSNRIWMILIMLFSTTALDAVMEKIVRIFLSDLHMSRELETLTWEIMVLSVYTLILLGYYVLVTLLSVIRPKYSKIVVCCAVFLADICLCSCAAILYRDAGANKQYLIFGTLSFIGVALLGSQIVKIFEMQDELIDRVKQETLLNSVQRNYFQSIIIKEEETRKYRHDMENHFIVVEKLLSEEKLEDAYDYIKTLKNEFSKKPMQKFHVGNDVIDALSEYYLQLINDYVDIEVNGNVPDDISIGEINLCTIYSNLIKNSVEELQKLNNAKHDRLKLTIDFMIGKAFFEIKMKNTSSDNARFNGIMTPTSKSDKKNHGIGLSNVRRAVDREHGRLTLTQSNGTFCADVIIPIP